jgi:hypothetical protein
VQSSLELNSARWSNATTVEAGPSARLFVCALLACAVLAAVTAGWLPLQASIVTLFLFAGPHNWFEFRYFLQRMPVRFGRSRSFFLTAFAGILTLTIAYFLLPVLYTLRVWPNGDWSIAIAVWNTLMLIWVGTLVWLRGRQKPRSNWANLSWGIPATLALISMNWLNPQLFSLGIVYVHPLIALWFLDRHLRRVKPAADGFLPGVEIERYKLTSG